MGCISKQAEQAMREQINDRINLHNEGYLVIGEIHFEMVQKAPPKKRAELQVTFFGVPPEVNDSTIINKFRDIMTISKMEHSYLKKYVYVKNGYGWQQ